MTRKRAHVWGTLTPYHSPPLVLTWNRWWPWDLSCSIWTPGPNWIFWPPLKFWTPSCAEHLNLGELLLGQPCCLSGMTNQTCQSAVRIRPHQLNLLFLIPSLIKNICFTKIKAQYNFYAHWYLRLKASKKHKDFNAYLYCFFSCICFFPSLPRCFLWIWEMRNRKFICYCIAIIECHGGRITKWKRM